MKLSLLKKTMIAASAMLVSTFAFAADSAHIRGEITNIDGANYQIKTISGEVVNVQSHEKTTVLVYSSLSAEDIKVNDYLGIPSATTSEGLRRAISVVVFPEPLRGYNEGEFPWDLGQGSRMTNATLAKVSKAASNDQLTVKHGETEVLIDVPEDTPIVTFAPTPGYDLKNGEMAIFFARKDGDKIMADFIGVSKDGSIPPL